MSDAQTKRVHILKEIVSSEDSYVQSLGDLIRLYQTPVRKLGLAPLESAERVFLNVEAIYNVHLELQEALKSGPDQSGAHIASVFARFAPRLRIYSVYVSGFEPASEELLHWQEDAPLNSFLEEQKASGALPLPALLIQPVQRICRYPLLFGEVLKNTLPSDVDRAVMEDALNEMEHVTHWINEEKRKEFNSQRMGQLLELLEDMPPGMELFVPGRQHISEGMYRVSDSVAMEGLPLFKVIIFNDMVLWGRPNRRNEHLKYEGHIMFDRSSRTERIGLDIVRVETMGHGFIMQAKDLVTTEHLYSVLFDAVKTRTTTLNSIHEMRVASAQMERERLVNQVDAMEAELQSARLLTDAYEKKIAALTDIVKDLCAKANMPVPDEVQSPPRIHAPPAESPGTPLTSARRRPKRLSLSPKMAQLPVVAGEVQPFVVIANQDFVSDDVEDLSFAFGELILVSQDMGNFYMGRPLEGEVFSEKKVYTRHVSLATKKGATYVRVEDPVSTANPARLIGVERRGGSFLGQVARVTINRSHLQDSKKGVRSSIDVVKDLAPSPSFRKKTPDRSSSRPGLKDSGNQHKKVAGLLEHAPGMPDHSQEVILKHGWLRKMGGTRKNWKRRFFFLSEHLLYYYENEKIAGKKPLGVVRVADALVVERSKKYDDGFQIPVADRLWEFRADTSQEADGWVEAIKKQVGSGSGKQSVGMILNPLFGTSSKNRLHRSQSATDMGSPRSIMASIADRKTSTVDADSEDRDSAFDDDVYDL